MKYCIFGHTPLILFILYCTMFSEFILQAVENSKRSTYPWRDSWRKLMRTIVLSSSPTQIRSLGKSMRLLEVEDHMNHECFHHEPLRYSGKVSHRMHDMLWSTRGEKWCAPSITPMELSSCLAMSFLSLFSK